jgi:hypothetical protein
MEKSDDLQTAQNRFDLAEVQRIAGLLWKGRTVIILMAVLATFLSIIYLHVASYTYTSTMTLIPTQSQQRDMTGQIGGLAALAGITMPGESTASPFTVYPETAHTRQVAADMIRNWPGVMALVFKDQWDPEKNTWHPPQSFVHSISGFLKPVLGIPIYEWHPPKAAELQQYIVQNVGIAQDKKKAMLTLTLNSPDPDFSRKFIQELHGSTDHVLRLMTLDRAKKYAVYLEKQLAVEQASAVRDVLTRSLSDQETLIMMGNSDTDFAAQPLGPAESSTRPTNPVPLFVLAIGLLIGLVVGGACAIFEISIFGEARRLYARITARHHRAIPAGRRVEGG